MFKNFLIGGVGNILPFYWDLLVLTVFSLAIYYWAIDTRLPEEKVDEYVRDVYPPPVVSDTRYSRRVATVGRRCPPIARTLRACRAS